MRALALPGDLAHSSGEANVRSRHAAEFNCLARGRERRRKPAFRIRHTSFIPAEWVWISRRFSSRSAIWRRTREFRKQKHRLTRARRRGRIRPAANTALRCALGRGRPGRPR